MKKKIFSLARILDFPGVLYHTGRGGDNVFIWGDVTETVPKNPHGAVISPCAGLLSEGVRFLRFDNSIHALVPDGNSGWFMGGTFTRIGITFNNRIAPIKAYVVLRGRIPDAGNDIVSTAE